MTKSTAIAMALWAATASPALAFDVDAHTSCSVVPAALQKQDQEAIEAIGNYVENTMDEMDLKHTENGDPGIMAQLSDDGLKHFIATSLAYCDAHPKSSIYNAAAFVYRGMRDLEMQFGVAK